MNDGPQLRLRLASNPLYLSGVRELLSAVCRRLGFAEDVCGQIALAVDEALCNVIRHGYDRAADRPIWLNLWTIGAGDESVDPAAAEGIRLVIEDEARQVEPGKIKGRNLEEIKPGGLGVHIIHEVMDTVQYEKREQNGMRLTMVKRRPGARAAVPAKLEASHG
ncbi:MAG: ATP-binding protein [Phycisphaerae bacterium]|nr:ATP-binding protein [Phycisphaerae bacterium]